MAHKLALCPAVSFAKGMQCVQFAEIMRRAIAERGGIESSKVLLLRELLEDQRGGVADVGVMREQVAALADVDGSQLSGPFVKVAEQVAVYGLEVGEVEPASKGRLRKFVRTCRNKGRLCLFEDGRVRDAEEIF